MQFICKSCSHKIHEDVIYKVLKEHNNHCPMCNSTEGFMSNVVMGFGDEEIDMDDPQAFEMFRELINAVNKDNGGNTK